MILIWFEKWCYYCHFCLSVPKLKIKMEIKYIIHTVAGWWIFFGEQEAFLMLRFFGELKIYLINYVGHTLLLLLSLHNKIATKYLYNFGYGCFACSIFAFIFSIIQLLSHSSSKLLPRKHMQYVNIIVRSYLDRNHRA